MNTGTVYIGKKISCFSFFKNPSGSTAVYRLCLSELWKLLFVEKWSVTANKDMEILSEWVTNHMVKFNGGSQVMCMRSVKKILNSHIK